MASQSEHTFTNLVSMFNGLDRDQILEARSEHSDMLAEVVAYNVMTILGGDVLEDIVSGRSRIVWSTAAGKSSSDTLVKNYVLLQQLLRIYPDRIPSKFWCAAVLIHIDKQTGGRIYPGGGSNKMSLSIVDGSLVKMHIQHIRALTRASDNSREPKLLRLKDLIVVPSRAADGDSPSSSCGASSSPLSLASPASSPPTKRKASEMEMASESTSPGTAASSTSSASSSGAGRGTLVSCGAGVDMAPVPFGEAEPGHDDKSRTGHLGQRPGQVDLPALVAAAAAEGIPGVTAAGQSKVHTEPKEKTRAWCLDELPVVDDSRVVPANFDMKVHSAYLRLPSVCLPAEGVSLKGKSNYTLYDGAGRAVQVHLANRIFFITKTEGSVVWDRKLLGSPQVSWSAAGSIDEVWDMVVVKIGGWTPAASEASV
jgi:hypothetical protein